MSRSRGTPVALMVASLTSVILPSTLMVTSGSRLASMRLRAYWEACFWAVTSRTAAVTSSPSSVVIDESEISAGNSLPSLRLPDRLSPTPIGRTWGLAKYLSRCWGWIPSRCWGTRVSIGRRRSSWRAYPKSASAWWFTKANGPSRVLLMMASSEQSTMAARRDWRASGAPLVASLSEGRVGWRVADYTWATETVTRHMVQTHQHAGASALGGAGMARRHPRFSGS